MRTLRGNVEVLTIYQTHVILLNNVSWLHYLNSIDFLKYIGKHIKINDMIKAEGYRIGVNS